MLQNFLTPETEAWELGYVPSSLMQPPRSPNAITVRIQKVPCEALPGLDKPCRPTAPLGVFHYFEKRNIFTRCRTSTAVIHVSQCMRPFLWPWRGLSFSSCISTLPLQSYTQGFSCGQEGPVRWEGGWNTPKAYIRQRAGET